MILLNLARGKKSCSKCGEFNHLVAFAASAHSTDGHKPACRECNNAQNRTYHYATIEHQKQRKVVARLKDPDGFREKRRARYRANPEPYKAATNRWEAANPERVKAKYKAWYEANKPHVFEKSRRRRALKLGRMPVEFTTAELDSRMSVFGHRCAYCNGPFQEVDHAIPLSRGGLHCLANLRPACTPCNRRKWARKPSEWHSTRRVDSHPKNGNNL